MKLPLSFYQRDDVLAIARELNGKCLYTCVDGLLTGGMIVETEAYRGPDDRGSHAWNDRRTPRNEMMYAAGGVVYMYICYGIHDMLNIVTGDEGSSHAILIRAIEPLTGLEVMRDRRNVHHADVRLCQGPGALAKALGLNKIHNGASLAGDEIWITDNPSPEPLEIASSARIGLNFPGIYRDIPWRFYVRGNRYVSRNKT
ncbi:DNA-3-methyladenine glycosylase [Hufsiella ginkgonis]|uniref:Putative 3-methyladenine DNA glycosylase n=1 Tax=Hufsiella ginkgonis TaxID=2695274 RepID=A0A7K1XVK6_9SPHI|nr:DNA-3-methyladenine glycosylase [Hufsiella ginkgonis]MXV15012.1 DNA-3-methyladenine glycosylase [Hufsiella ginkgonis]